MTQNWTQNPLDRRDFLKLGAAAVGTTLATTQLASAMNQTLPKNHRALQTHKDVPGGMALLEQEMVEAITPKDFTGLIGKVQGLSESQLRNHFKLYEGYVNKLNMIHQQLAKADADMLAAANATYAPFRELNVELSFAQNGVVLHELYFANLGFTSEPASDLKAVITRSYGTWENYLKHLVALGKSMRGWVLTGFDLRDGHIRNYGLDSHNQAVPLFVYPLLVLDVFEHAYMIDFATDRAKYLDVFLGNVNWSAVQKRLLFAVHHLMAGPQATL